MKLNYNNILIFFTLAFGFMAAPIKAKPANSDRSSILIIPTGAAKSGLPWNSFKDIELAKKLYGRYGIYIDATSDVILNWYKQRSVDEWLRPSHSDVPQMTSSVTQDKLVFRWTRDCYSPELRYFSVSFRRTSYQDGKNYWLGIMLEDRNGSFARIDLIERAFDKAWKSKLLKIKSISAKPLFIEYGRRFQIQTIPTTLEDAIRIVHDQLSESDKKALLGKAWREQYNISLHLGIIRDIENDFDIDGACNPLSHIVRKSDGALMPESWVSSFILKGALTRMKGEAFDIESELNQIGLIPKK